MNNETPKPDKLEELAKQLSHDVAANLYGYFRGGSAGSSDAIAYFKNNWRSGECAHLIERIEGQILTALRSVKESVENRVKAHIDYRVQSLLYLTEPRDEKGCVIKPDFDKAMYASTINALVDLRAQMAGEAPVGYPEAKHAYMHDEDMQRLRNVEKPLREEVEVMKERLKLAYEARSRESATANTTIAELRREVERLRREVEGVCSCFPPFDTWEKQQLTDFTLKERVEQLQKELQRLKGSGK